jgi:hypothetical protein
MNIAPQPILSAALRVLYVAGYTTRNWTLNEAISRNQVNDLWEALHDVPHLLANWRDNEAELLLYLDCYDEKWDYPKLRMIYEQARDEAVNHAAATELP